MINNNDMCYNDSYGYYQLSIMFIKNRTKNNIDSGLVGNLLVSTPYATMPSYFVKSVILILVHDQNGTLGVIVNKIIDNMNDSFLFDALDIKTIKSSQRHPVLLGGPLETEKGLIIHSQEYKKNTLIDYSNKFSLSSNLNIMKDIANDKGPEEFLLFLGYAGWAPGQLDMEIRMNNWLSIPYSKEIVFSNNHESKWNIAINSIGTRPEQFISSYGNA